MKNLGVPLEKLVEPGWIESSDLPYPLHSLATQGSQSQSKQIKGQSLGKKADEVCHILPGQQYPREPIRRFFQKDGG